MTTTEHPTTSGHPAAQRGRSEAIADGLSFMARWSLRLVLIALGLTLLWCVVVLTQPILQSRSVDLHPAVVLLAVAAGGSLYGIPGAFLAVPVTAGAATVLTYLLSQADRVSADDPRGDAPAGPEAAAAAGVPPAGDGAGAGSA